MSCITVKMLSRAILLTLLVGCGDGVQSLPNAFEVDAGSSDATTQDSARSDVGTENQARVFRINPITTEEPVLTTLTSVGDDVDGTLTSALEGGVRKLRALSCVDEGETLRIPGIGERRICSLRQLANKHQNGNFVYEDWALEAGDATDVFAEVSVYYHAEKIYNLITSSRVGVFDHLPGRHQVSGEAVPLNLVVNYQLPGAEALLPASFAFFSPAEHMRAGMAQLQGLMGFDGDFLVFGQGGATDFAYDGETVYHEFGHAVVHATAELQGVARDQYGLTNLGSALNEGIAHTFAFLGSDNPALYRYLDHHHPGGFYVDATSDNRFPQDLHGLTVYDGWIVMGANYEIFEYLKAEAGFEREDFVRILLLTLQRLRNADKWSTFAQYAERMMEVMVDEGLGSHTIAIYDLFEGRGFFHENRAIDITASRSASLLVGSAANQPWNTWFEIITEGERRRIAPAYNQVKMVIPPDRDQVIIDAIVSRSPADMTGSGPLRQVQLSLFLREGDPVNYLPTSSALTRATFDREVHPDVSPAGTMFQARFALTELTPGSELFLQFVNHDSSSLLLSVQAE